MIKRLLITGYKAHELGIFDDKHLGIEYIKIAFKNRLISLIEEGLEWVIVGGQLGVETWIAELVIELRDEFPELKLSIITPFVDQEKSWKEDKQEKYHMILAEADYVNSTSKESYKGPWQFKNRNSFVIKNTDAMLVLYDDEKEGSPKYIKEMADWRARNGNYEVLTITSFDLQEVVEEEQQKNMEEF